jgi:hypothetical protein
MHDGLQLCPFWDPLPQPLPCQSTYDRLYLRDPNGQFIRTSRLVAIVRYRNCQQAARRSLAEGILRSHLLDRRLHGHELHPFFRITCNASLSRLRSATQPFQTCVLVAQLLGFLRLAHIHPPYLAFRRRSCVSILPAPALRLRLSVRPQPVSAQQ